mmetsp:Transcript_40541/g.53360  ORF Transcript_40541/g.53360 Transcript_40541/m.53360 type:complete len:237 (-) Transcript_40541:535-1245(-)
MRKHFFLKNIFRVLDTVSLTHILSTPTTANEIKSHSLVLNDKCLFQRGPKAFHHLCVRKVVNNVFQDISVRNKPKGSKDDHHRNIGTDVRQGGTNLVTFHRASSSFGVHLHIQGTRRAATLFNVRASLADPGKFGRLFLFECVHMVRAHSLLGNQDLLRPIDHKVTALIIDTLSQLRELLVCFIAEHAVGGPQHDGNVPKELLGALLHINWVLFFNWTGLRRCIINSLIHINVKWR